MTCSSFTFSSPSQISQTCYNGIQTNLVSRLQSCFNVGFRQERGSNVSIFLMSYILNLICLESFISFKCLTLHFSCKNMISFSLTNPLISMRARQFLNIVTRHRKPVKKEILSAHIRLSVCLLVHDRYRSFTPRVEAHFDSSKKRFILAVIISIGEVYKIFVQLPLEAMQGLCKFRIVLCIVNFSTSIEVMKTPYI